MGKTKKRIRKSKGKGNGQANGLPPKALPADKADKTKRARKPKAAIPDDDLDYMADAAIEIALCCMRVRNVAVVGEAVNRLYPAGDWASTTPRGQFAAAVRRVVERRMRA